MICTKIVAAVFHFDDFFSCSELAEGSSFTRKALPAHWMPSSVHARLEYEAPSAGRTWDAEAVEPLDDRAA